MKRNIAILIEQAVNRIDNLNGNLRFTREEQLLLCESFEPLELCKHELVTHRGKVEKYLYFVEEGVLRYWMPDGEDRKVTVRFAFGGDFAGAYESMKTGQPSAFHIEALEPVRLWRIRSKDLAGFYSHSLNINKAMRIFLEGLSAAQDNRVAYLLHLSPEYRYQFLMNHERLVILSVAQKYIASYLGIAPQTLCKVRRCL